MDSNFRIWRLLCNCEDDEAMENHPWRNIPVFIEINFCPNHNSFCLQAHRYLKSQSTFSMWGSGSYIIPKGEGPVLMRDGYLGSCRTSWVDSDKIPKKCH